MMLSRWFLAGVVLINSCASIPLDHREGSNLFAKENDCTTCKCNKVFWRAQKCTDPEPPRSDAEKASITSTVITEGKLGGFKWCVEVYDKERFYRLPNSSPKINNKDQCKIVQSCTTDLELTMEAANTVFRSKKDSSSSNVENADGGVISGLHLRDCKDVMTADLFCEREREKMNKLRAALDIDRDKFTEQLVTLKAIVKPGGKSSASFLESADKKLLMKRCLPKDEITKFEKMLEGTTGAERLVEYYIDNTKSKLNPILMFGEDSGAECEKTKDKYWIVIPSTSKGLPDLDLESATIPQGKVSVKCNGVRKYDLKGTSRSASQKDAPCNDADFAKDPGSSPGKLYLNQTQCKFLEKVMGADMEYLEKFKVIDYSFLVTERTGPAGPTEKEINYVACSEEDSNRYCAFKSDDKDTYYTIEIIDYLVNFGKWKALESVLKKNKFYNYKEKMMARLKQICPTDVEVEPPSGLPVI